MNDPALRAARWRVALTTGGSVLTILVLTLAPTVTLWDSGELLAAARGLGIPHPPGTPLFVLLAHVWGTLLPFGTFAWAVNLLSAVAGAATAALFALALHETLRRVLAKGAEAGAVLATLTGALTATLWRSANETEVYAFATFLVALTVWLAYRWREARRAAPEGGDRPSRYLLLIVYLLALSVGNHLLTLLAGPAIIVFLWSERRPGGTDAGEIAIFAALWAALAAVGLASEELLWVAALGLLLAFIVAARRRRLGFAFLAVGVAVVGISTWYFLLLRSGQHPALNEGRPDQWSRLLDVIGRTGYPVRTPFDDPLLPHGAANPGRSLRIIGVQLANYLQYFTWQWGAALPDAGRGIVAVLFASLGFSGCLAHRRLDRSGWRLFLVLWLVTGLGLVAYLNFRPGFSQFHDQFPDLADHEVRERDYFYLISFLVWGCWAGMQLVLFAARRWQRPGAWRVASGVAVAAALLPLALNWPVATRRGPDRTLASDVAYDLLNSVGPYGILVTNGDNDTFPLWYLQEVEGIRRDVTVVCLALANTDWYIRGLRDAPVRPFDEGSAPAIWRGLHPAAPDRPLFAMTDAQIAEIAGHLIPVTHPDTLVLGPIRHLIPGGITLYPSQFVLLRIIAQNLGHRPFAWAMTGGRDFLGLDDHVVLQGMAWRLAAELGDSNSPRFGGGRLAGVLVDVPRTDSLLWHTFRYGDLRETGVATLGPAERGLAADLGLPFTYLASVAQRSGDRAVAIRDLKVAARLAPSEQLDLILGNLESGGR